MGWIIALLILILLVLGGGVFLLVQQLRSLGFQISRLRMEAGAGLGVNIDHTDGYLDGGHLQELRDHVRQQQGQTQDHASNIDSRRRHRPMTEKSG